MFWTPLLLCRFVYCLRSSCRYTADESRTDMTQTVVEQRAPNTWNTSYTTLNNVCMKITALIGEAALKLPTDLSSHNVHDVHNERVTASLPSLASCHVEPALNNRTAFRRQWTSWLALASLKMRTSQPLAISIEFTNRPQQRHFLCDRCVSFQKTPSTKYAPTTSPDGQMAVRASVAVYASTEPLVRPRRATASCGRMVEWDSQQMWSWEAVGDRSRSCNRCGSSSSLWYGASLMFCLSVRTPLALPVCGTSIWGCQPVLLSRASSWGCSAESLTSWRSLRRSAGVSPAWSGQTVTQLWSAPGWVLPASSAGRRHSPSSSPLWLRAERRSSPAAERTAAEAPAVSSWARSPSSPAPPAGSGRARRPAPVWTPAADPPASWRSRCWRSWRRPRRGAGSRRWEPVWRRARRRPAQSSSAPEEAGVGHRPAGTTWHAERPDSAGSEASWERWAAIWRRYAAAAAVGPAAALLPPRAAERSGHRPALDALPAAARDWTSAARSEEHRAGFRRLRAGFRRLRLSPRRRRQTGRPRRRRRTTTAETDTRAEVIDWACWCRCGQWWTLVSGAGTVRHSGAYW